MSGMSLSFLYPAALLGLLALPLLWWLLRLTPPSPKRIVFPALALLQGLTPNAQTPAHTPWWLLLLRLLIIALAIIGLARPILEPPDKLPGGGAIMVVIDNGWASASDWPNWQQYLDHLCQRANYENRDLIFVPTAPSLQTGQTTISGALPAVTACQSLPQIQPQPWGTDHAAVFKALSKRQNAGQLPREMHIIWLNDGLLGEGTEALQDWLLHSGGVTFYGKTKPVYMVRPPEQARAKDLEVSVLRAAPDEAASVTIEAHDAAGRILGSGIAEFAEREKTASAIITLPGDLRNQVTRLSIAGQRSAGGTLLLDGGVTRHNIGLIGDESGKDIQPLLSGLYYLERALAGGNDVKTGAPRNLVEKRVSIIVSANDKPLLLQDMQPLTAWIDQGGVFVQCAGPELRQDDQSLLPAPLLDDARSLGGSLSWEKPQSLRAFPAKSPFAGLDVPADVAVERQILANPTTLPPGADWAMLTDGTPLVTGAPRGRGYTVLFHVPCNPGWSNLPLSGLFVQMLDRLAILSGGDRSIEDYSLPLPPWQMLDGFGSLQPPRADQTALAPEAQKNFTASPEHPPGYYGAANSRRAFNVGQTIFDLTPFRPVNSKTMDSGKAVQEWRPWLLAIAITLFLADMLLGFWLRGLFTNIFRSITAAGLLFGLAAPMQAAAADGATMTTQTWLGIVANGAGPQQSTAAFGLTALSDRLMKKTAIDDIGVVKVDLESDDLSFFPFLYWPLASNPQLSAAAQEKLQHYLSHGGMIYINLNGAARFNPALEQSGVVLPMLKPLAGDHPLFRTFYLMHECPGRVGGELWVERDTSTRQDGVPSVFVGTTDLAGAWAGQARNRVDRELALRCGVNLVIYALTGSYKTDQIHVSAILERLKR